MAVNIAKTMEAQKLNNVLPVSIQPTAWRVEIDEFLADTKMTNLFLLALDGMQQAGLGMLGAEEVERKQKTSVSPLNDKDKVDWWTYYNLSGIHGYPLENWNGVKARMPVEYEDGRYKNYFCRHGSIVFPTWHRAYIYQFEQAVSNQMRALADNFDVAAAEKRKYQDAARRFRLPFWDPFMPRNALRSNSEPDADENKNKIWGLPEILSVERVWVRKPKTPNELTEIANPLASFAFPSDNEYNMAEGRNKLHWKLRGAKAPPKPDEKIRTARRPGSDGKTNLKTLNEEIQSQARSLATKAWHMLNQDVGGLDNTQKVEDDAARNQARTWESFSNHAAGNGNSVISIESWHDDIHDLIRGQMGNPAVAGFDPIFWLHHCNIDRLFALFQVLYPDKYVPKDGEVNASSPLYPFFKDPKDFWNSSDVEDWKKVGFAIPGSTGLDDDGREIVKEYLRSNYYWMTEGPHPPETLKYPKDLDNVEALRGPKTKPVTNEKLTVDAIVVAQGAIGQAPAARLVETVVPLSGDQKPISSLKDTAAVTVEQIENEKRLPEGALQDVAASTPTKMVTWNAHLKVKKYAFNGSFTIHFFIGRVNDEKKDKFMVRKNEVGFSGIFTSSADAECANCEQQRDAELIYEDVVPITSTLVDYLDANPKSVDLIQEGEKKTIRDLEPDQVRPFLKEHLKWRIVDLDSNLIDDEQRIRDSGLEVKVISRMFETPNDENKLGVYSDPVLYQDITELKQGGYGYVWP